MAELDQQSVRVALQLAWEDYRHTREQTWKTVQILAVLGAGLVTVDAQCHSLGPTLLAGTLVLVAGAFGVLISIAQRKAECRKHVHIRNFERVLGLDRADLVPDQSKDVLSVQGGVALPSMLSFWQAFDPRIQNTAVFILRMQITIVLFAAILMVGRLLKACAS